MVSNFSFMKLFDAILFDIDGTLLDTKDFILQGFNHTLSLYGEGPISWSQLRHVIGKPLVECYQAVSGSDDVEKFIPIHREFQEQNLHLSKPFPGAKETLEVLKRQGIIMGAVTTRGSRTASSTLELAELLPYLDVMITADDVQHCKPHPEALLKALEALCILPGRALMVGDTSADVFAGKNAGTATVGVSYGFHGDYIKESEPDFIIHHIQDILSIALR